MRRLLCALCLSALCVPAQGGPPVKRWLKGLASEDPKVFKDSYFNLKLKCDEYWGAFLEGLKHRHPDVRYHCAVILTRNWGVEPRGQERKLTGALADPCREVREYAAMALAACGKEAYPLLLVALAGDGERARDAAALALARLGKPGMDALQKKGERVRRDRARWLRGVGSVVRAAQSELRLMHAAQQEGWFADGWNTYSMCRALRVGDDTAYKAPDTPLHMDWLLREMNEVTLRLIDSYLLGLHILDEALEQEDPHARAIALRALGGLVDAARDRQGVLVAALDAEEGEVRAAAVAALAELGATFEPVLLESARTGNARVCTAALEALARAGRLARLRDEVARIAQGDRPEAADAARAVLAELDRGIALAADADLVGKARALSANEQRARLLAAARAGSVPAMLELARLTAKRDGREAVRWHVRAAEAGDAAVMLQLAEHLFEGTLGERDVEQAFYWWRATVKAGTDVAALRIGELLAAERFGPGPEEWQRKEAERWLLWLAEKGHAGAQFRLGEFHDEFSTFDRSRQEAIQWYTKAALQGERRAYFPLARCRMRLSKSRADAVEAYAWMRVAVDAGDKEARRWFARQGRFGAPFLRKIKERAKELEAEIAANTKG